MPGIHRSKGRRGGVATPPDLPLWGETLEAEAALRAEVAAFNATRRPVSIVANTLGVLVVIALAAAIAIELERRALEQAILLRPPILRGDGVAGFAEFARSSGALNAAPNLGIALASGAAAWGIAFAVKGWRYVVKHAVWLPVAAGAAIALGAAWYMRLMMIV